MRFILFVLILILVVFLISRLMGRRRP